MTGKLKKYYKRELFSYRFCALLPFILLLKITIYRCVTTGRSREMELIVWLLVGICAVVGIGLVICQSISMARFRKDLRALPDVITEAVERELDHTLKRGRFLLTGEVLIYFGFFKKRVFRRSEIYGWKRSQGVRVTHNPKAGTIEIPYDDTLVRLKDGRKELIEYPSYPLEAAHETKGELPLNAFVILFFSTVFITSMTVYPLLLAKYAPKAPIERFLFYRANEAHYCLTAVIISAAAGSLAFMIRCFVRPLKLYTDKTKAIVIVIVVAAAFVAGFYADERKDALLAEEDLNSYHSGNYETVEGIYKEKGAVGRNEVGWSVYDYASRRAYDPVVLSGPVSGLILLKSAYDELPEEGRRYRVEYLKNTKVVVSVTRVR